MLCGLFGAPPFNRFIVSYSFLCDSYDTTSPRFHMPLMLYHRFLHYPWLTRNVDDADVFIIPAYNLRPSPELPCANNSDLFETLYRLNPKLKDRSKDIQRPNGMTGPNCIEALKPKPDRTMRGQHPKRRDTC